MTAIISAQVSVQDLAISFNGENVKQWDAHCVADGLYLGSCNAACDETELSAHKITHILTVMDNWYMYPGLCKHLDHESSTETSDQSKAIVVEQTKTLRGRMIVPIMDWLGEGSVMAAHFVPSYRWIRKALQEGGKVLVHCHAGISRSTTLVCNYIMRRDGLSFDEALSSLRQKRRFVQPNPGFCQQLRRLERRLQLRCERKRVIETFSDFVCETKHVVEILLAYSGLDDESIRCPASVHLAMCETYDGQMIDIPKRFLVSQVLGTSSYLPISNRVDLERITGNRWTPTRVTLSFSKEDWLIVQFANGCTKRDNEATELFLMHESNRNEDEPCDSYDSNEKDQNFVYRLYTLPSRFAFRTLDQIKDNEDLRTPSLVPVARQPVYLFHDDDASLS